MVTGSSPIASRSPPSRPYSSWASARMTWSTWWASSTARRSAKPPSAWAPAAARDEGVAQVVAPSARDAEGLPEDVAREGHRRDREDPEIDDDHARVVVLAEEKGHHADEDEGAHCRGLRDVGGLRQPRSDAPRAVQVEAAEGHAPDDEDGKEHEQIGPDRRDAVPGGRPGHEEAHDVREEP